LIKKPWGVYGIPETFIVNSKGIIKYRLVGPITEKNYDEFYVKIKESEK
jgi:cytochrome c biogenesis protein CcmG/thiol:disulfide interchange protein DsbE